VSEATAIRESWHEIQERLLQWGLREIEHRKEDLLDRSPQGLERAKLNAKKRRQAANLDINEASIWMKAARTHLKEHQLNALHTLKSLRQMPLKDVPTTEGAFW